MKGLSIGNSQLIREVHNSFRKPDAFFVQQEKEKESAKEGDEIYHFISYVPFGDRLYELDGLQKGPIVLKGIEQGEGWIEIAKREINKRIVEYSQNEIGFNLLAINADREYMVILLSVFMFMFMFISIYLYCYRLVLRSRNVLIE